VQRLHSARQPALLVISSLAIRSLLAMMIFYGVMAISGGIIYLFLALVSFVTVRFVLTNRIRPHSERGMHAAKS
jgi:hypothetical protein